MSKKPQHRKPKRRKQSIPPNWQTPLKMHAPSFRWLAYRQSRMAVRSPFAVEDQAWVDEMSFVLSD